MGGGRIQLAEAGNRIAGKAKAQLEPSHSREHSNGGGYKQVSRSPQGYFIDFARNAQSVATENF